MTSIPPDAVIAIGAGIVLVAAVIAFSLWWKRTPERVGNPYVEALTLLVDGDRRRAFEKLQASVRSGLAPTDAYIRLGRMLREDGDASKALQIHKSLTVKEDLSRDEKVELFVNIAEDYSRLGRSDKAVSVLESAVRKLGLKETPVYTILARESHRLGRTEDAYNYLRELRKSGVIGEREVALYLATAGEEMAGDDSRLKDARRTLQRALKHDDTCAPAHLALGDAEERDGDEDSAIARWRRAAVLSPELSRAALTRLGRLMFNRGTFSEIERVYREVLEARPDDEPATLFLASFYRKQGRIEDAIVLLEDYHATHPRSVESTLLLTSMYAAARDTATLERFLDENEEEIITGERFVCSNCGHESDVMRWHCGRCNEFDTFERIG